MDPYDYSFYDYLESQNMDDLNQDLFQPSQLNHRNSSIGNQQSYHPNSSGDPLGDFFSKGKSPNLHGGNSSTISNFQSVGVQPLFSPPVQTPSTNRKHPRSTQQPANPQPSVNLQPLNVNNSGNVQSSTNLPSSDPPPPPRKAHSLKNQPSSHIPPRPTRVQSSLKIQDPATSQPSTIVQPATDINSLAHVQRSTKPEPPSGAQLLTDVLPLNDLEPPTNSGLLACALWALHDLQGRVSDCQTLAREIEIHLQQITQPDPPFSVKHPTSRDLGKGPGSSNSNANASIDLSRDLLPPSNGTTFIDLTDEALPSSNDNTTIDLTDDHRPSTNGTASSIDLSRDPRPGAKARLAARKDSKFAPSNAYPVDLHASSGPKPPVETHPSKSRTSGNREVRTTASARSNGPSDAIEGMYPGAGVDRLLGLQRANLPKGNVNGLCYSCEARCGYPDGAAPGMISCDSAIHRRQPRLKLLGGRTEERGWYHLPCAGYTLGSEPSIWTCPSCVRRGTTSTDDHDHDEDDDDNHDGSAGPGDGEDSEDEYHPGKNTPDEDSDDDDDGHNDAKDDSDYKDNQERREKGTNKDKKANKKHYPSDGGDHDQDDNQPGNADGSQSNQQQQNGGGKGKSYISHRDNQNRTQKPSTKTKRSVLWSEEEKVAAMDHMRDVVDEQMIFGEARFVEVARRMQLDGYDREWAGVKNAWNRGLRERSGIDERKNKNAPLTTSKQDAEAKRKTQERKAARERDEMARRSTTDTQSQKSVSPKREYMADEDEEEVIPQKRRRASPYDGDCFLGLP